MTIGAGKVLFPVGLEYFSPMPLRYGAPMQFRIPETFTLHVAPFACGRRMCIGTYRHDTRKYRAHLYISEEDLVMNSYDDLIADAVGEILQKVKPRPRGIIIALTCIDDLLGNDHEALIGRLQAQYAPVRFAAQSIDPIRLGSAPTGRQNVIRCWIDLMQPVEERARAINLLGDLLPLSRESDLLLFTQDAGITLNQPGMCATFDEFQAMAAASLNLAVSPVDVLAAHQGERHLGIPFIYHPNRFSLQGYDELYQQLGELFQASTAVVQPARECALAAIAHARQVVGSRPIAIDQRLDFLPFTLARVLIELGFSVRLVLEDMVFDGIMDDYNWLKTQHPEMLIAPSTNADVAARVQGEASEYLCLGFTSAYLLGSGHLVELPMHEFHYGYSAITALMEAMAAAAVTTTSLADVMTQSERQGIHPWQKAQSRSSRTPASSAGRAAVSLPPAACRACEDMPDHVTFTGGRSE